MVETWNPDIKRLTNGLTEEDDYTHHQIYTDEALTEINEDLTYLMARNGYLVDFNEADQGAAGGGGTIKDLVDAIGTTKQATIFLPHTQLDQDTTTYTFSTNESIPSNIDVVIQKGALITPDSGVTVTFDNPSQIKAGKSQQVFAGDGTITFTNGGAVYPEWWGIDGTADDVQINAAIASIMGSGGEVRFLGYTYNTTATIGYTGALTKDIAFPSLIGMQATGVEPIASTATVSGTEISYTGTGNAVSFAPTTVGKYFMGGVMRDITIRKAGNTPYPTDGSKGLYLSSCLQYRLYNVTVLQFETGFHSDYGWSWDAFGMTAMFNDVGVWLGNNSNACSINGLQGHANGTVNLRISGGSNIVIDRATLEGANADVGVVVSSDGTDPSPRNINLSNLYLEQNPQAILVGVDEDGTQSSKIIYNVTLKNVNWDPPVGFGQPMFELDNVNTVHFDSIQWGQDDYPMYSTTDDTFNITVSNSLQPFRSPIGEKLVTENRKGKVITNNLIPDGLLDFPSLSDFTRDAGFTAEFDTTTFAGERVVKVGIPTGTVNNLTAIRKYIKVSPSLVGKVILSNIRASISSGASAVFKIYDSVGSGLLSNTISTTMSNVYDYGTVSDTEYLYATFYLNNTSGVTKYLYISSMVVQEKSANLLQVSSTDILAGLSGTATIPGGLSVEVTLTGWERYMYRVLVTPLANITCYVTEADDKFTITGSGAGDVNWFVIPRAGVLY